MSAIMQVQGRGRRVTDWRVRKVGSRAMTSDTSGPQLPERARVVVVGGGVIGTSVAYHLAHMGCTDVVLLERDRLTSGTTWHAAGLMVTFGSTVGDVDRDAQVHPRPVRAAGGRDGPGHRAASRSASSRSPPTRAGWRSTAGCPRSTGYCGVDVHEISPGEVKELFPLARTDDVLAGFYVAEDGRANPVDVTMSLAKGARHAGRADHRGRRRPPAS